MRTKIFILFVLLAASLGSCRSKKNFVYLQNSENYGVKEASANYEPTIQPDDVLSVTISSDNIEGAQPFNTKYEPGVSQTNIQRLGYLVDKNGMIQFPVLGGLKVGGLKRSDFESMMKEKLTPYLSDAVINLRILNFKVTVLGEVNNPGVVDVSSDRVTLLEVLAQSGDLGVQALRKNILIVRDNQGVKSFHRVDVTTADFVDSPFYYMKQNDVVYVEPRRAKIDATAIGGNITTAISIFGFLLTTTILLIRL